MTADLKELKQVLEEIMVCFSQNEHPDPQLYTLFIQQPEYSFQILELLNHLEEEVNGESPIYLAYIFALDVCVAQFQSAAEASNKMGTRALIQLMNHLAQLISTRQHSLGFWLPVLNAFYEVQVELTQELKNAYFELANEEGSQVEEQDEASHLKSMRELLLELADLSVYDIAEHFFAQSYAMPAEFFSDLIVDLTNIEEGQEIALLILVHPKAEVRRVALSTLNHLIDQMHLSTASLSRLQMFKLWYPQQDQQLIDRWIRVQRKKGVIFEVEPVLCKMKIKATEIDGTGSQGLFIDVGKNRAHRLCGLLLNSNLGLKDAWLTPFISAAETKAYHKQAFDENVTLREVDSTYFKLLLEHFLSLTSERGEVPPLHFFEIQELIGLRLKPIRIDYDELLNQLSVQISPFTPEAILQSLQRSKSWLRHKAFTESWYLESPAIDKIVNHNSSFIDGVKICRLKEAMDAVFLEELELHRDKWLFHFLWVALWAKAKTKKNEKTWQDSFFIAHTIQEGIPLKEIPVMKEICHQTVINSIETMQARKTHLSQE